MNSVLPDGFMIVIAAFIYGLVTSSISLDSSPCSKEVREVAVPGSNLATQKAFNESTKARRTTFKWPDNGNDSGRGNLLTGDRFRRLAHR